MNKNEQMYEQFKEYCIIVASRIKNEPSKFADEHEKEYLNGTPEVQKFISDEVQSIQKNTAKQLRKLNELKELFEAYLLND